jgi:hypothetical protein
MHEYTYRTSIRQCLAHKECSFAKVFWEKVVISTEKEIECWVFALKVIEFLLSFGFPTALEIFRGFVVVSNSPFNRGDEFVRAIKHL